MLTILRLPLLSLFLIFGFGCSSTVTTKQYAYSNEHSYALNIMKAANMGSTLRDSESDSEPAKNQTSSLADPLLMVSSYKVPPPNISSGSNLALNAAFWLLSPGNALNDNRVIAWIPKHLAGDKEPHIFLGETISNSASNMAREKGTDIDYGHSIRKNLSVFIYRAKDLEKCSLCDIQVTLDNNYSPTISPEFVGSHDAFLFTGKSDSDWRSGLDFKKGSEKNSISIALELSKNLPEWIFFYIAPGKMTDSDGVKIDFPLIINQGKVHYFVTHKTS